MNIATALKTTRDIWRELAENPSLEKTSIPLARLYDHCCPCCSYVNRELKQSCDGMSHTICQGFCPMWEAWGRQFCETGTSPYNRWNMHRSDDSDDWYDRQFFALLIAEWADYLLKQHEAGT